MKLNLGCGNDIKEGYVNIDINSDNPKVINCDIANDQLPFSDDQFSYVYCHNVLEHIPFSKSQSSDPLIKLFNELYRVCKNNAVIHIYVPYDTGHMASRMMHTRFFNCQGLELGDCSYNNGVIDGLSIYKTELIPYKNFYKFLFIFFNDHQSLYETTMLKFLYPAKQVFYDVRVKK